MNTVPTNPQREITPLTEGDCLLVFDRKKLNFDFPLHFHPEYEINFIFNAEGAVRIVGEHREPIGKWELVLTGPNLMHVWEQGDCHTSDIHEITIQFHRDLFHQTLLDRNIMKPVKDMLDRSTRGIAFSEETIQTLQPRITNLAHKSGIDALIELVSLLFDLSNSRGQQMLSSTMLKNDDFYNSGKIKNVHDFVQQHYAEKIKVEDMAQLLNMTEVSFSRFIKQRTGKTFVEYLNHYRISMASRWLIESNLSVSEIAYKCGFNNLANFNRIFKKAEKCTPSAFRENFAGIKRVN